MTLQRITSSHAQLVIWPPDQPDQTTTWHSGDIASCWRAIDTLRAHLGASYYRHPLSDHGSIYRVTDSGRVSVLHYCDVRSVV